MRTYDTNNERITKFFGKTDFEKIKVSIIGLGGGGEIALHLLRSGIINMNLFDFDILESGNLVRHICGSKYVGKNKAIAVKMLLEEYIGSGKSEIRSYDWNIFDDNETFLQIIQSSDVVIIATDTDSSKYYINEMCVENKIPAIFVRMFEDGCGGEVFSYIPGMACFECLTHFQNRQKFLEDYSKTIIKKDCSSKRDFSAMPGLGIDQSFLCSITARKALDIILKTSDSILAPVGKNWIVWSLFGIKGILEEHLSSLHHDYPVNENCSCCK